MQAGNDQTRQGAAAVSSGLSRRQSARRRHGHRRAGRRRPIADAERRHAAHGLRLPRSAPPADDRTVRDQADLSAGGDSRGDRRQRQRRSCARSRKKSSRSLLDYFHPLKGGEDGQGWPFGGTIYYSRVNQRVFTVPGCRASRRLVIVLDGEEMPVCTDVTINEAGLLYRHRASDRRAVTASSR